MRHFGPRPRGLTVLKIGGTYATHDSPECDVVESATEVYLGGHVYTVDAATASALNAAGYVTT